MRLKRGKTGDAMGRPSWRSLFLGDASASFFCETEQTGRDVLKILPHPGLRFALSASPYGRRRASHRPGCGKCQGNRRTRKTNPTSSEINLLQQKNGLDLGVHRPRLVSLEHLPRTGLRGPYPEGTAIWSVAV
jgi:hypothetical protein